MTHLFSVFLQMKTETFKNKLYEGKAKVSYGPVEVELGYKTLSLSYK